MCRAGPLGCSCFARDHPGPFAWSYLGTGRNCGPGPCGPACSARPPAGSSLWLGGRPADMRVAEAPKEGSEGADESEAWPKARAAVFHEGGALIRVMASFKALVVPRAVSGPKMRCLRHLASCWRKRKRPPHSREVPPARSTRYRERMLLSGFRLFFKSIRTATACLAGRLWRYL